MHTCETGTITHKNNRITMRIVHKKIGETPLQCIQRLFDTTKNTYTYAGRLDPMAEGLLIILENKECKNAKQYHSLNKTYEYTFIVGIGTDTYDCLGKIIHERFSEEDITKKVKEVIDTLTQTQTLPYPPYSSKTINGIPLFEYARQNKLDTINIPTNTIHITQHELNNIEITTVKNLVKEVIEKIEKVQGNFRQKEVLQDWKNINNHTVQHFSATIAASTGTYVRAIVNEVGNRIGYPTVTTSIKRTKIGKWTKPEIYNQ